MVVQPPALRAPIINESVLYPWSDGKPMAENTLQWEWIVLIKNGLDTLFADRPDVFVASDLLWYPIEGKPQVCTAPDVMAVFGRPKGNRGSYMQWKEDGLPFQVVFEILSAGNSGAEMVRKYHFYQRHGVLEYYVYDPGELRGEPRITELSGWQRKDATEEFSEIAKMDGWLSPRLGITFRHDPERELELFSPDGKRFESHYEVTKRAERSVLLAEQNAQLAEQNAQLAERFAAQLRAAGIEPAGIG